MTATPRSRRAAPLAPRERRAAIVRAVTPLVREHGPSVSTGQIAEAAGVAEGTIFRAFPDKEALITAVVDAALDTTELALAIAAVEPGERLEPRLVHAVQLVQDHLREAFTLIGAVRIAGPPRERDRDRFHAVDRQLREALVALVRPHTAELTRSPHEVVRAVRMMTFSATHPHLAFGPPLPAAEIVALVLDGVRDHTPPGRADEPRSSQC